MNGPHRVRAEVDRAACMGYAAWVALAPDAFRLDESGVSVPQDIEVDRALLERAVEDCPRSAIRLVPASGRR
jgi:ferredoxin